MPPPGRDMKLDSILKILFVVIPAVAASLVSAGVLSPAAAVIVGSVGSAVAGVMHTKP